MGFPVVRMRRLRQNENIRRLVREHSLSIDHLIYPLFIKYGKKVKEEISSMPGVFRLSIDNLKSEISEIKKLGIPAVILFGIPEVKDDIGSEAYNPDGIVQKAVKEIKNSHPDMLVITDVCIDEYTSHGHCGIVRGHEIMNDQTLEVLSKMALTHVRAGADIVAPSDMMDGRVDFIRKNLDEKGFSKSIIMSYAAKYASAFYGPFREACDSAPQFGDRKTYQMDPANCRESLREVILDVSEGADIVMVKPAMTYLDIIKRVKEEVNLPVAAYNVSGEYSMVVAAAKKGWVDGDKLMLEILLSIHRAGADMIITYFAKDVAKIIG